MRGVSTLRPSMSLGLFAWRKSPLLDDRPGSLLSAHTDTEKKDPHAGGSRKTVSFLQTKIDIFRFHPNLPEMDSGLRSPKALDDKQH